MQLVTFELAADDQRSPAQARRFPTSGYRSPDTLGEPDHEYEALDFARPGHHRLGALIRRGPRAGDIVDLNRALASRLSIEDSGAPEAEADSLLPADALSFLARGPAILEMARDALAWAETHLELCDTPDLERTGAVVRRDRARLHAPIERPGKIVCMARNYEAHAAERGAGKPVEPILFIKASSAIIGPGDEIRLPAASQQVDYEGELAIVIGQPAAGRDSNDALACVAGYTIANDVTARDFQNIRGQRYLGKSCDTFAPMGPCLVTRDEIPDPHDLELQTRVNGELRQSARTGEMLFRCEEIIAFASRLMTLLPGDVVLTGTPAGVGVAMDPPSYLQDGDVVDVEIAGIGRLRNHVVQPRKRRE
jgi:acylpyruvate hydrolase